MSENVYDKAREVLKERGWTQGDLRDEATGRVCLVGALCEATGVDYAYELPENIYPPVAQIIAAQWPTAPPDIRGDEHGADVPIWNDDPDRTFADVDLVLDKAARIHDEQAS